jgi:hypothetical protein
MGSLQKAAVGFDHSGSPRRRDADAVWGIARMALACALVTGVLGLLVEALLHSLALFLVTLACAALPFAGIGSRLWRAERTRRETRRTRDADNAARLLWMHHEAEDPDYTSHDHDV